MYQPSNILIELQELSPAVADIARVNVFKVPDGYFDSFSGHTLLLAQAAYLKEENPIKVHTVPEGYFDSLADSILNKIKNESIWSVANETKEISELVAGIGNRNVFIVPKQYFDRLTTELSQKVTTKSKVVSMKSRFTSFRYAAAAVLTGLIGLSIFFMLNKNNSTIKPSSETIAVMNRADQIIKTNSFDKELENISDAAIVQFLESKGQNVEAALVASLDDEKNLPNAVDYLINENTLDEVLKTLDLNN
jgi:hypothetical protein